MALVLTLASCTTDSVSPIRYASVSASGNVSENDNGGGISIAIVPNGGQIVVKEPVQLTASLTNPAGHAVPSNRRVGWEIFVEESKEPIATLTEDGVLTGFRVGATVIVHATINQGTVKAAFTIVERRCDPKDKRCCERDPRLCKKDDEESKSGEAPAAEEPKKP